MSWLRPRSIRHKLTGVVLVTSFVALSMAGFALVIFDLRSYQHTWEQDLLTQADLLGLATAPALSFNDPRAARENLALLRARPTIVAAAVYTPDGQVFATYGDSAKVAAANRSVPGAVEVEDGDLVTLKEVVKDGEHLGAVYLRAHHERLDRLQQYLGVVLLVIVGSLGLALLLSNQLLSVVTRPILAVSDVARRIAKGRDYSLRATRSTDDEVGQVVDAFNAMLAELERRARALEQVNAQTLALNAELEDRVRRRTAQLETANRELEAFSYSASHDLRAPLHSIDSFSNLLEKSTRGVLNDKGRHYLHRIQANAKVMSGLIDALLALAHVSRVALERQPVDMSAMAWSAIERCRENDPERDCATEVAEGMDAMADPALVAQVIHNLIGNAWKFTSRTPLARITVGCERSNGGPPTYFVRDNGAGFDMAYADKLFSAFQRLHSPAEFPGTGIGLATVHKIVTRHEGRIWAQSTPGEGAVFFFTLDNAQAAAAQDASL